MGVVGENTNDMELVTQGSCSGSGEENNCDTSKTLVANDMAEAPLVAFVSVNGDGTNGVTKIVTQTSPKRYETSNVKVERSSNESRRSKEDNMAIIFMGFILVFLIWH